jgi:hypothetical protein
MIFPAIARFFAPELAVRLACAARRTKQWSNGSRSPDCWPHGATSGASFSRR